LAPTLLAIQPACSLSYLPLGASNDGGCQDATYVRPAVVDEVSLVNADDWAPAVSGDERVMVFASWRPGGSGGSDLWIATRAELDRPFSAPRPIAELNTPDFESGPSLSADGLTICFESDRGGSASADLYIATRPDRTSPFGAPVALAAVNSDDWDANCFLDGGALSIVFAGPMASGGKDLWTASRPGTSAAFGAPVPLSGVNTPHADDQPFLSADGLALYFASDRPGGSGGYDIYVARRESPSAPFGPAENLAALNTGNDEGHPSLSGDGERMYLNRNAHFFGGQPPAQIWVAERQCGP
jgi:Tol biopolymer transport system component